MAGIATGGVTNQGKGDKFSPASSFLELVEYDPSDLTMDITFKSGAKHRYFRVYPSTFLSFKQSPTHDSYYARAIKGNLMSAKLVDASIGRNTSTPLKTVKKEHTLDAGLRKQQSTNDRIAGTVARAINAAGIP